MHCWIKTDNRLSNDNIVMEIYANDTTLINKKYTQINNQVINDNTWNSVIGYLDFPQTLPNIKIKIYIENNGNEKIVLDDFRTAINIFKTVE